MNPIKLNQYLEIPEGLNSEIEKIQYLISNQGVDLDKKAQILRDIYESLPDGEMMNREVRYVIVIIAELYFMAEKYKTAKYYYSFVMRFENTIGNPFLHLRLGQIQYYLGKTDRMIEELSRALIMGGESVFEGEDKKFIVIPKRSLKKPFWSSWKKYEGQDWESTR